MMKKFCTRSLISLQEATYAINLILFPYLMTLTLIKGYFFFRTIIMGVPTALFILGLVHVANSGIVSSVQLPIARVIRQISFGGRNCFK